MDRAIPGTLLFLAVLLAACDVAPTGPITPSSDAQLSAVPPAPSECPAHHDYLVDTESSLRAALGSAKPGSVIAIEGVIEVFHDLEITTPAIVLTCAAPGGGPSGRRDQSW